MKGRQSCYYTPKAPSNRIAPTYVTYVTKTCGHGSVGRYITAAVPLWVCWLGAALRLRRGLNHTLSATCHPPFGPADAFGGSIARITRLGPLCPGGAGATVAQTPRTTATRSHPPCETRPSRARRFMKQGSVCTSKRWGAGTGIHRATHCRAILGAVAPAPSDPRRAARTRHICAQSRALQHRDRPLAPGSHARHDPAPARQPQFVAGFEPGSGEPTVTMLVRLLPPPLAANSLAFCDHVERPSKARFMIAAVLGGVTGAE